MHQRLGHVPYHKMSSISGIPCKVSCIDNPCDVCKFSSFKRREFDERISIVDNCFDLVHMDIWGPFSTIFYTGHSYFLTIVDDHSRCTWLYLMKH